MDSDKEVKLINLDDIIPNRFQPRLTFDESELNNLSQSIKQYGIFQPLVVRRVGNKYEIIAGERRYKASTIIGLKEVPCVIVDLDDNASAEIALVENIQRRDLTAIEEAKSYQKLLDRGYITQDQLAKRMGKSQSTIANKVRLLNLDEEVQQALLESKISERHARSLLSLKDTNQQKEMLKRIMSEKLTVRNTDLEIKKLISPEEEKPIFTPLKPEPVIENTVSNSVPPASEEPPEVVDLAKILNKNEPVEKPDLVDLLKPEGVPTQPKTDPMAPKVVEEKPVAPIEENPVVEPVTPKETVNLNIQDLISNIQIKEIPDEVKEEKIDIEPLNPLPMETQIEPLRAPEELPIPQPAKEDKSKYVTNNIRTAINTTRECISTLEKYGFIVEKEELDLPDNYQITIKIKKTE